VSRRFVLAGLFVLLAALPLAAQSKTDSFRKEADALQRAADQAVSEVPGISVLQAAKAAYIAEFGVVVTMEVALEPPRNPFSSGAPDHAQLLAKQKQVRDKMKQFLSQHAAAVQSVEGGQFVAVVVHLFNSNPVDSPNLPRQMVFVAKKSDASNVSVKEF